MVSWLPSAWIPAQLSYIAPDDWLMIQSVPCAHLDWRKDGISMPRNVSSVRLSATAILHWIVLLCNYRVTCVCGRACI